MEIGNVPIKPSSYCQREAYLWDRLLLAFALSYLTASAVSFYTGSLAFRAGAVAVGGGVYFIMFICSRCRIVALFSLGFACVLYVNSFFSLGWSGLASVFTVFVFIGAFGVAWYAMEFCRTFILYEIPFYLAMSLTVVLIVVFGYGPVEFDNYLTGFSRNSYCAILDALAVGYIVSRLYRRKPISLVLFVVLLAASFPLYGRSGIGVAVLLLIGVIFRERPRLGGILAVGALIFGALVAGPVAEFVSQNTNFAAGLRSVRYEMVQSYIARLDVDSMLVGLDLSKIPIIAHYGGNPHNAFLRLHAFYGVSSLLVICLLFSSLVLLIANKQHFMFWVSSVMIGRAMLDIIILFNLVDYAFYPIMFYAVFSIYFSPQMTSNPNWKALGRVNNHFSHSTIHPQVTIAAK